MSAFFCAFATLAGSLYLIERAEGKLIETVATQKRMADEELQYTALQKLALETQEERTELEQYILTESEVINFLSLIERVGSDRGVAATTKAIAVSEIAGATQYELITINLELEGSLPRIQEVIDLYEHLPYQSSVERVTVDRSGGEEGRWRSSLELTVTKLKP